MSFFRQDEQNLLPGLEKRPDFDPVPEMKKLMAEAVEASGLSRDQVVDRMDEIAKQYRVPLTGSKATLDKWLSQNDKGRPIPVRALAIFCAAVGSSAPLQAMAAPLGCKVIGPGEIKILNYGRAVMKEKRARAELRKIEREIR